MKMDDASLKELLRAAGRSEGPPPNVRPDLADCVRRLRARRRRTRNVLGGLLAAAVLLGASTWMVYHAVGPTRTTNNPIADGTKPSQDVRLPSPEDDVEQLRAEIAELAAEAQRRQRVVEEMTRRQRSRRQIARFQKYLDQPDPLEVARIEIEKTAFLLVDHAEQRSLSSRDDFPAEEYRRVVEHFPGTNAARTAEKKLSQLKIEKGDL